jgi:hypothetical protein
MNPVPGDKFGKMTIVGPGVSQNGRKFPVQCECGSRVLMANVTQLARWQTNNNGCMECRPKKPRLTAFLNIGDDPTYRSWYAMKQRCTNPKNNHYKSYGGRGIKIHPSWMNYKHFLADMGPRPEGKTLDRRDNNGNYEPGNCRWATDDEQFANTSRNIKVTVEGVEYRSHAKLCKAYGVCHSGFSKKIRAGLTPEQALGIS